jgi:hypothetical protein
MAADDTRPAFRFENYEGFLGFGASDAAAAKRDFLQAFPTGTPLDAIDAYFKKIGGRCFELPRDWPGRMICNYEHPKFRLLPFLPILSTWSIDIWYEGEPRTSTRVEITAGAEGL